MKEKRIFKKVYLYIAFCMISAFFLTPFRDNSEVVKAAETNASPIALELFYDKLTPVRELNIEICVNSKFPVAEVRYALVRASRAEYFHGANKGISLTLDANNRTVVTLQENQYVSFYAKDTAGNEAFLVVQIKNIDNQAPELTVTMNEIMAGEETAAYLVTAEAKDNRTVAKLQYTEGMYADAEDMVWSTSANWYNAPVILESGKYTFRVEDEAGNVTIKILRIGKNEQEAEELKAVWISYLEFADAPYTEDSWKKQIDTMFNQVAAKGMNAVVVQVRPFSDALYPSEYYPWSVYVSGKQGKDPGFDPLAYMVKAAHERGLAFHAWVNPYRITNNTTDITTLSKQHPARVWLSDNKKKNDRNVLSFGGKLYYNPASTEVQELIVNGIVEIVSNYEVDGIHFDDYFYPSLGKHYETIFDAKEYDVYHTKMLVAGEASLSIADWRRENVNTLIRSVYSAIKEIDSSVEFGISPGGFIDYLSMDDRYYVDYETWLSQDGYIDYLCPQLYWSNSHSKYPFNETLLRFIEAKKNPDVKLYVGIAAYKVGLKTEEPDWYQDANILKNMIAFSRTTDEVDGFMFFRYDFFISKEKNKAMQNLLKELAK